jgi:hypothetical protein
MKVVRGDRREIDNGAELKAAVIGCEETLRSG